MKGLLLKDWYLLKKHSRLHLFVILFFLAGAVFSGEMFFLFYPCVLAGMLPTTLLAYDEQSKWVQYSATFPYKRSRIVGSTYLIGLILIGSTLILTTIASVIFQMRTGSIDFTLFSVTLSTTLLLGVLMPSIALPFMFKYGVQKGRTAYFIVLGIIFGSFTLVPLLFREMAIPIPFLPMLNNLLSLTQYILLPLTLIIAVLICAVSYLISVKVYEKKEL